MFRRRDPDKQLARAIAKRGRAAQARIEDLNRTGEHYLFVLSFTTDDGRPITTTVRQRFPESEAQRLRPGADVAVMYDADDPGRVVILGEPRRRHAGHHDSGPGELTQS